MSRSPNAAIAEIKSMVLAKVTPTEEDYTSARRVIDEVACRVAAEAEARNLRVRVEVEGSVAKDTWISTDRDIDIFIIFPEGTPKEVITEGGLALAKAGGGGSWTLGYAEHAYVEAYIGGFTVDIVPASEVSAGRLVTAVDRTPLHTRFITERFDERMRDDVRILKQFMKGIGVYGAELKIGGFSGYLCELLILQYGSFEGTIAAASGWGERTALDYMGHYKDLPLGEVFDSPLIMVDPIDRRRNAAAAVTRQAYATFIAASRRFLRAPAAEFLLPEQGATEPSEIELALSRRGATVLGIEVGCPRVPSDILWGEVYRSLGKVAKLLGEHDFTVRDSAAWSDEDEAVVFLLELESAELREGRVHAGPKVWFAEETEAFLAKYERDTRVLDGPYVKGDRWYVELKRKYTDAAGLMEGEFGRIGHSKDLMAEVSKGFRVLSGRGLIDLARRKEGFAEALLRMARKRPPWLR